jgi:hypothetical protein
MGRSWAGSDGEMDCGSRLHLQKPGTFEFAKRLFPEAAERVSDLVEDLRPMWKCQKLAYLRGPEVDQLIDCFWLKSLKRDDSAVRLKILQKTVGTIECLNGMQLAKPDGVEVQSKIADLFFEQIASVIRN